MELSCAFAPGCHTADHIVLAEELGYRRAWVYDSPALYADVWVTLGLAAKRTSSIDLATGVLIPSLRHPMVTAAAVATLCGLAPGRFTMGVGSGFTGRHTLGKRPNGWAFVEEYVRCVHDLLAGEEPLWEDARIAMMGSAGLVPDRPLRVPTVIAVAGPRGEDVARRVADGVIASRAPSGWDWSAQLTFGTVLDDGESISSERVRRAAGHGAAVAVHALYERAGPEAAGRIPGMDAWLESIEAVPAERRHLETHRGHLVELNAFDQAVVTPDLIGSLTWTGTVDELASLLGEAEAAGATEIAFQPAGDIERELRAFARLAPLIA
jgi:5,10-methylenetetrahydromethanopterin reductase